MTGLAATVGLPTARVVRLVTDLVQRRLTVATAESLTGGLLAALLTEVPGSSAVLRGGLIVYATELKHRLAGVDAALLAERGPVDPQVAVELARGARQACTAEVGVGLTGVAGPDPQDGVAVGTWFCAVAGPGERLEQRAAAGATPPGGRPEAGRVASAEQLSRDRAAIRAAAVCAAVELLELIARPA